MVWNTRDDLAERLSALLRDLDAAIQARYTEPSGRSKTRRGDAARPRPGLRGIAATALRWFSAGRAREGPQPGRSRPRRRDS